VPRGLRHAFGLRTAIATALADNETGRHVEDCILTGGLDTQFISWSRHDGIGCEVLPSGMETSCPTTSTTDQACGSPSAARIRRS